MATILIVDDRPANREYLVSLLSYGGHRLLEAGDGEEALRTARAEQPDLVIADILMPTMDGYELVRQIRMDPAIAHIAVIFYTAHYHEREAQALARTCGVSAVITKPSEPEAVLRAVSGALGVPGSAKPAPAREEFDRKHLRVLTDKLSQKADALEATNLRLSALIELSLKLGSELDLHKLVHGFGRAAREIIGARYSITGILDDDGRGFRSLFTSGVDAETAARLGSPDPRSDALYPILWGNRASRLRNPGGDPAAIGLSPSHPPIHSWLGVPIVSPTRVYGYIGLIDKLGSDEFSQEDERLAVILAAQVGRVYQNGHLYADVLAHASELEREVASREQTERALAQRVRDASMIAEVAEILTRSITVREMLQLSVDALARQMVGASALIWTYDPATGDAHLEASAGPSLRRDQSHRPIPLAKMEFLLREGLPYSTNDVAGDPWIDDRNWAAREGITAAAAYPLPAEGQLGGAMVIYAREPITPETLDALGSVAREIALALESKFAERALREREEHIRLLLDSTAEAIYGIDLQGRCTFANSACARLLGYADAGEFAGRNMHALTHHTRADGTPYPIADCKIYRAFHRNEGSHVQDEVLWRADGSSFPAEYWSYPVRRDGEVVGCVVTFLDITERKRLEAQFREAQQRLRHIVVSSPAVLFTLGIAGNEIQGITWVSDNLLEVFGYPPDAAIGKDWWMSRVHPDDVERVRSQTHGGLFSRGHSDQQYRFRHADGRYSWTQAHIRLIHDETGSSEAVGAWSDITETKAAEEEQARLRHQLQQAQKLETVGRLAGGVAHDFNNLLTVINGYSGMLLKSVPPEDPIRESIDEIRIAGERAAGLSRQLLLVGRQQVAQVQLVNLNDVVTEVEKMLRRVIGEDIVLESELNPSLGSVVADPGQLHQVLMNLAVNARDAMPSGGKLLIETDNVDLDLAYAERHPGIQPGRYVQLKVTDTGIGMSPEVLSHLYEPFFTTKSPGKGTGLGLATVYGIVKQSGGTISAYSEPGEGTAFTVCLPRSEEPPEPVAKPEVSPATLRGTETVLVVEDQDQVRRMTALALRECGYRVIEAANPGEALLHCEQYAGPIHLLLTDVVMPGMTGPDLARRIEPLRPSINVLFMSGYSERAIEQHRDLDVAGRYLQKPFSAESLATHVREVLGAPRPAGTILVVDDDRGIRNLLRKVLAGVGYTILEASDGNEAIRVVETNDIDLVIIDLVMPEREGIETIQRLHRSWPELKMIAMSGKFPELLAGATHLGAAAAIPKPIQPEQLLKLVGDAMLNRETS